MHKDTLSPSTILIIKTSSLGDIIQSFNVLDDLKNRFPEVSIDWAVESVFASIVSSHPLVRDTISLNIKQRKKLLEGFKNLRKQRYDLVFDLQGNTKSGLITLISKGKKKIGFGFQSVREWPNILTTNVRFNISKDINIRDFHLELIEKYFNKKSLREFRGVHFKLSQEERSPIQKIIEKISSKKTIMVAPFSKWINKQLHINTLTKFLKKIEKEYEASFILMSGGTEEKVLADQLSKELKISYIIDRPTINLWQNLMNEVDLLIAVDSSALHLCGTTLTPSFSIFGPTAMDKFKPTGARHTGIQCRCPYGKVFTKQCPMLRSCKTGACIKDLKAEELFQVFQNQCDFQLSV